MEYLPLKSLHDVVGTDQLAENEILTIAIQILQAVRTMHAAGYIHRDLKPQVGGHEHSPTNAEDIDS